MLKMKLKKIKAGVYETYDGKVTVTFDNETGYWYAEFKTTGQSVVDCEKRLSQIKQSLGVL